MTELPTLFRIFTDRLNELDVGYFVTGSVAGIIYGEPRITHDVDLVLELLPKQLQSFVDAFPLEEFYAPPPEVIETELRRETRGHFNLIHHETGFKADVYLRCDDLHAWAFRERRRIELGNGTIWLAPPEYVILRKLQYYKEGSSPKHLTDIRGILSQTPVAKDVIAEKALGLGLAQLWHEVSDLH
ncbi:MAG: hypothetical protein A2341_03920 [Deltaproteobacteria bacterium RIFOXYB12_FULL_58_9]|nr:MAG: hypothetical protein A2341_03920 [Deltaproteobacteria bacterium RIFOXYB12_FULL_58_9]